MPAGEELEKMGLQQLRRIGGVVVCSDGLEGGPQLNG